LYSTQSKFCNKLTGFTNFVLLQTYKWRQANKIDTILKDYTPDPELCKLIPYDIVGYDKEGCPSK